MYGFDLEVDERDDKELSQRIWHVDADDTEDPSHFGTIVLMGEPDVSPDQSKGRQP